MVGLLLTDVPGASASYLGGVISYATRLKSTLAGVDATTLAQLGPVASARLPRWPGVWRSDVAPTGELPRPGSQARSLRTAILSARSSSPSATGQVVLRVKELSLEGERDAIRQQAAEAALALLADALGLHSISSVADDDANRSERGPLWCCQSGWVQFPYAVQGTPGEAGARARAHR